VHGGEEDVVVVLWLGSCWRVILRPFSNCSDQEHFPQLHPWIVHPRSFISAGSFPERTPLVAKPSTHTQMLDI
jgi:hypothetical protein